MRRVLALFRRRPEVDWLPMPYDQAILMPDPMWRNFDQVLDAHGKMEVLAPRERQAPLLRDRNSQARRDARKRMRAATWSSWR